MKMLLLLKIINILSFVILLFLNKKILCEISKRDQGLKKPILLTVLEAIALCPLLDTQIPILFLLAKATCYLIQTVDRVRLKRKKNYLKFLTVAAIFVLTFFDACLAKSSEVFTALIFEASIVLSYTLCRIKFFTLPTLFCPKRTFKTPIKISAVIPNYNYEDYLEERVNSILNQTYPVYEIVFLDDKSSDNSRELIEKLIKNINEKYPQIKTKKVFNTKNSGSVFKQWAKAFAESTGDYVWICEADDSCSKHFLSEVCHKFTKNPNLVISYSESSCIDEKGRTTMSNFREWIDIFCTGHWNHDFENDGKKEIADYMCTNNTIANASGAVFKKQNSIPFEKYLKEAQAYHLAGDWYFYYKVLLHGDIAYCAKSLNYHRMHSKSVTLNTDNLMHYKEITGVQNSIKDDLDLPLKSLRKIKERDGNWLAGANLSDEELKYGKIPLTNLAEEKGIKDDVLLSIIIPVYNTEKYLERCLSSVFKTLPEKTEVLIVNDGSTDNSQEIINKFAEKHPEITVINQANQGLAMVKNNGLKAAKGRYVIFLDSDDYITPNAYSTMLKQAIDEDLDMIHCDISTIFPDGGEIYYEAQSRHHETQLENILECGLMASSCNKMVKRKIYHGLTFPAQTNNEDIAVTPIMLLRCKKIGYINSSFYKYYQHSDSINNKLSEKRFDIFKTVNIALEATQKESPENYELLEGYLINNQILPFLLYVIGQQKNKANRAAYEEKFCEKFSELAVVTNKNRYVDEFLRDNVSKSLLTYLKDKDLAKIDKLLQAINS